MPLLCTIDTSERATLWSTVLRSPPPVLSRLPGVPDIARVSRCSPKCLGPLKATPVKTVNTLEPYRNTAVHEPPSSWG